MEKKFMCFQKSHNGILNVSFCDAKDLLLQHLNKNGINYCSQGKDGRTIQLYYRLRNTGFRIQQNIYIGAFTYRCSTSVAESPVNSAEKQLKLLTWVCQTNKQLSRQEFKYDYGDKQLQYINRMTLSPRNSTVNTDNISERFDEFISQAHYVLDVEYADFLLQVLK